MRIDTTLRDLQPNALTQSGKPLFFRVVGSELADLMPRVSRLGESIRVCARSLSSMQKEALVCSSRANAVWRLASDEGDYLAGFDEAPCPLAFFTTGMVSSYLTEFLALAKRRSVAISRVRFVLDSYYTMAGSALKGTMTAGAKAPALTAEIDSEADPALLSDLVHKAVTASPPNGLLRAPLRNRFALIHNGRALASRRAGDMHEPVRADFTQLMAAARPKPGHFEPLVRRGGKTPKLAHTVTLANDSLADQQSRLLHVRGICRLRDDGLKEVEQHLYNPHGSIFYFLCDEARENGAGRAPDAASYVAAGIAFCFMTQVGRYASIARRNVERVCVIQDLHWSRSPDAGGGDAESHADPVETRVFIDSNEDDDFARTLLDMAEQTCFLHALCRTELQPTVAVRALTPDGALPIAVAPGV
jgi:hypothetical protein